MKQTLLVCPLILMLVQLSACIEVRDKNDDSNKKVVLMESRNLTIDEPYVLADGSLVPKRTLLAFIRNPQTLVEDVVYNLKFDHLTLKDGGVIYTMGYNTKIEIEDLESTGGLITTFPNEQEAPMGKNGIFGGRVSLYVRHARGHLALVMKGEKGGRGLKGLPPSEDMFGRVESSFSGDGWVTSCYPGKTGYSGGAGAMGGDSGTASVQIDDNANFTFDYRLVGGDGGAPGEGGDGGGANNSVSCRGDKSLVGPQGPKGVAGIAGGIQAICIQLAGAAKECKNK